MIEIVDEVFDLLEDEYKKEMEIDYPKEYQKVRIMIIWLKSMFYKKIAIWQIKNQSLKD